MPPPLWQCPRCHRYFANRNQSHACGRYHLRDHFADRDPEVVKTFRALLDAARECGPVKVLPEKTRIAFQVRMSFAAFTLRRNWIDGHVVLARRRESPRFSKIQEFSPINQLHQFRIHRAEEVDAEVVDWLREAYAVGEQRHLESPRSPSRRNPHTGRNQALQSDQRLREDATARQ